MGGSACKVYRLSGTAAVNRNSGGAILQGVSADVYIREKI